MTQSKYLTVSQLTQYIKAKFTRDPYLETVYLTGEISGYRSRGKASNQYFSIKDDNALISAVIFRGRFQRIPFDLEEGMKVLVKGRVGLYEKQGSYQLYVDDIQPDGIGSFYIAYQQLKEKLSKEGLFNFERKPIPTYPKKIAVVTSPTGSVVRDIITTVRRRYPIVEIVVYPTVVQGDRAKASIIKNLQRADQSGAYDVIIVGRGGGSIEDLWCFNEEEVARTIAACRTPVISSVGHETDYSLADEVADRRAPTPTAAAELATPVLLADLIFRIQELRKGLYTVQGQRLKYYRQRLANSQQSYIFTQPQKLYDGYRMKLLGLEGDLQENIRQALHSKKDQVRRLEEVLAKYNPRYQLLQGKHLYQQANQQLRQAYADQVKKKGQDLHQLMTQLDLLSPLKRLSGGYAYLSKQGHHVRSVQEVKTGDQLEVQLLDGRIYAQVEGTESSPLLKKDDKKED
ncbi:MULTISPECIES: exodeoxyribonuclease VII large subunit [Aerococcus]|uniref:Exodeoxyribonuclease 7 large subunit n=1 Tax=Aerococcus sanguinicola TaxID=119206 RepID=A0A5N1GM35_9LACT|nr:MULTISPECIES: exodeoxyribonuclease VII large subunit [Aerococcus]KAA9302033.1 exodeoxyribonuclease VII large subunit [Aerococcus sanguinicola]MDK6368543.1 exodeoxyribonuclease VII large subunit [Aerococcus sp. UMB9870]MDK6686470.1 exodeoxyribonuclease VII large subunit [Aerococcus sp. UMB8623]MDK6940908.1 exodeoxyribonuclease VII large subunit [Aerococcus sp. UMB8487]OFK21603.1 exodeoxyribonuclease VII large subunit [Aerococcus sp. HMSC072A12]